MAPAFRRLVTAWFMQRGGKAHFHRSNILLCRVRSLVPRPQLLLFIQRRNVILDGSTEQSMRRALYQSPPSGPPSLKKTDDLNNTKATVVRTFSLDRGTVRVQFNSLLRVHRRSSRCSKEHLLGTSLSCLVLSHLVSSCLVSFCVTMGHEAGTRCCTTIGPRITMQTLLVIVGTHCCETVSWVYISARNTSDATVA
jgi:hypothetical protein